MPDHVKPGRGLRAGAEQPVGRKQAGKGQRVDNRRRSGEQIAAREQQQRPRARDGELRKQQDGGDQIVDRERGLIARNEGRDRGERYAGKGHGAREQHRRDADDGQGRGAVAARGRQGREKDVAVVAVCIVVSCKLASNAPIAPAVRTESARRLHQLGHCLRRFSG